ncbi:MAG: nucleotidyltransferase [Bacilli bacterium]
MIIGIIAEYNPFHNGHKYQIEKIKEKYPDSTIIVVMSSSFTQRGDVSLLNKWKKTKIALENNVDLIIELPFIFSTQSADIFAKGAIEILKELKIDLLIFGSESNNIKELEQIALTQINNKEYDLNVKKYLDKGYNYPTSMNKALKEIINTSLSTPNDLLGLSYIKEIIKQQAPIKYETIKRTNDYHSTKLNSSIVSATSIRQALIEKKDIKNYVPSTTYKYLKNPVFINNYFSILKYKILSTKDLSIYLDVDEGIENRIKKEIINSKTYEELIEKVKTKRYTYNKISRALIHILCDFTKEDKKENNNIKYIRVLGFSNKGRKYLNKIKKEISIPLITKYKNNGLLDYEYKITCIYSSILEETDKNNLIQAEYKNHPIIKK